MANLIARVTARALRLKPVRAFLLYVEHRGPMLADSVTYRTLFSVFAGVLLGFSLAALWLAGNPVAFDALTSAVDAAIPGLVGPGGVIDPTRLPVASGLTITSIVSVIGLIGAAIGAIGSLRTAFRSIADTVGDDVFFVWVILRNLVLAIIIGATLVVAAAVTFFAAAGVGLVNSWLGLSPTDPLPIVGTRVVSAIVVLVLDTVVIALLFRALSGVRASARALWSGALLG